MLVWAARWRLAGAPLAYANALVDLSGRGYVDLLQIHGIDPDVPVEETFHQSAWRAVRRSISGLKAPTIIVGTGSGFGSHQASSTR